MRTAAMTMLVFVLAAAPADAVFHGRPVAPEEAPWLVALRAKGHVCGGALVTRDRVVTAAHCVQGVRPGRLRVEIGGGAVLRATVHRRYDRVVLPTDYTERPSPDDPADPRRNSTRHDLAVVRLSAPVDGAPPLAIATTPPHDGERTITFGRGRTGPPPIATGPGTPDPGRSPAAPRAAEQTVVPATACAQLYPWLAPDSHLCTEDAGPQHAQACEGDSGSPVVVVRDGVPQLAGVVTWGGETRGRDCGEGLPDVSERVAPLARLLRTSFAAPAPYAQRRTRVRRQDGVLSCISGPWRGKDVKLRISWFREGRLVRREIRPGVTRLTRAPDRSLRGIHARRIRARPYKLGCTVRAETAGGWAEERSYNQR